MFNKAEVHTVVCRLMGIGTTEGVLPLRRSGLNGIPRRGGDTAFISMV